MTVEEMVKAIQGFGKLEDNWDSYGAIPISEATVEAALHISGHLPPGEWQVYPQCDGEIWFERDEKVCGGLHFCIIVVTDTIRDEDIK